MSKEKKNKRNMTAFEQLFVVVLIILGIGFATGTVTIQNPDNPCHDMCNGLNAYFRR